MLQKDRILALLKKKEVKEEKKIDLEKGDIPALLLAACSVFIPIVVLFIGALALFIWLILAFLK